MTTPDTKSEIQLNKATGQRHFVTKLVSFDADGNEITDSNGDPAGNVVVSEIGKKGAAHNRLIPAAAVVHPADDTNNTATFTEAESVRTITIMATIVTPVADNESDEYVLVAFDATNGIVAASWLSVSTFDVDGDVMTFKIPLNTRVEFSSTSNIRRVDVQPTSICHIVIEGV